MPRRVLKLVISLFIVAIVSYVFYLNPHSVPVNYGGTNSISPPLALTLIVVFCSGATITAFLAFIFDMEYLMRLRRSDRREKQIEDHRALVVSAREQLAAGLLPAARERLQKILSKDPQDTVARIELAESYLDEGKPHEALQVLEDARTKDKSNLEILFLAAELNAELGNITGAFDNYQLILRKEPRSPRALGGLVDCCRVLERYDNAVEYQMQLLRASKGAEQTRLQEELADLEVRAVTQRYPEPGKERRKAIEEILGRHRDFPEALRLLAVEERESLRPELAAKHLIRAFKSGRSVNDLELLADLWLQAEDPTKAVNAVRLAVQQDEYSNRLDRTQLENRMFLVALLVFLESISEAKSERRKIDAVVAKEHGLGFGLDIIDSWLTYREGEVDAAFQELFQNLAGDKRLPGYSLFSPKGNEGEHREHWVSRLKTRRAIEWQSAPELSTS